MKKVGHFCPIFFVSSHIHGRAVAPEKEGIEDRTETNLVNLRRTIYLTIMNALNYEEAVHKLLKVQIKEGEEVVSISEVTDVDGDIELGQRKSK